MKTLCVEVDFNRLKENGIAYELEVDDALCFKSDDFMEIKEKIEEAIHNYIKDNIVVEAHFERRV